MKKYKLCIIFLSFLTMLQSCGTVSEGFGGSKRSKSGDEFLVHKKKPLVLPPDFEKMPSPNSMKKKEEIILESSDIKDLLNIKKKEGDETFDSSKDRSLEESILSKINKK